MVDSACPASMVHQGTAGRQGWSTLGNSEGARDVLLGSGAWYGGGGIFARAADFRPV